MKKEKKKKRKKEKEKRTDQPRGGIKLDDYIIFF